MTTFKKILTAGLVALAFSFQPAWSAVDLTVSQGKVEAMPIAITPFDSADGDPALGEQMSQVITEDLRNCGLFRPLDRRAFIQDAASLQAGPRFGDWRILNIDALVTGRVTHVEGDKIRVEFRLFDVVREAQMEGKAFTGTLKEWRRMAHKIADAIYERITGGSGYFDTKIVYVARTQNGKKRTERLAVMDQDGANLFYLSGGESLVLTPRFSPDMKSLTYMDFGSKQPRVYVMNLATKQKMLMGNFPGMTFAPRFAPDNNKLVMSFAKDGRTSLFELNLLSHGIRQLTHDPVIDTSPSYSPDGGKIVFNSDRSGQTHIYVMNADGSGIERISFGSGSYRTPVWSPRGDYIAFTKIFQGRFYIGVIRPDGTGERLITSSYVVDNPSWSPNGRLILFTKEERGAKPGLYVVDITGFHERRLPTPGGAIQGSWSPLIP
jgi:TolB protein